MKPYERRESNAYPYFKLARWDTRNVVWKDGRTVQATEEEAIRLALRKPGRYRISVISENGRTDQNPFSVTGGSLAV